MGSGPAGHHRHGVIHMTTAGEMSSTEQAPIPRLHAFDLVMSWLFKILKKVGCPPGLFAIIHSFHEDMQNTVFYNGATSEPVLITSGVKQHCVLAQPHSGSFSPCPVPSVAMMTAVYLHTRSDGHLFNLTKLWAKTKVRAVTIREALFANDAATSSICYHATARVALCYAMCDFTSQRTKKWLFRYCTCTIQD